MAFGLVIEIHEGPDTRRDWPRRGCVNFREKYMRRGCMEKGDGRVVMPQITVRRRISLD
jgi:hypothetical protein